MRAYLVRENLLLINSTKYNMVVNNKSAFISACSGMLLFGIVFTSIGTVLPLIRMENYYAPSDVDILTSLLPAGILVGSLIFGPMVDRVGYKLTLCASTLLIFLSLQGIAISKIPIMLKLSFFIIGVGGGMINGATNALVADISDEKGANLSILGIFYGIGAIGMPMALAILISNYSYNAILSGIGIFVLVPFLYFIMVNFPSLKMRHGLSIRRVFGLFSASIFLLGLLLFFESGIEGITNNWLTSLAIDKVGVEINKSLGLLMVLNVSMIVSRFLLSFLLRRFNRFTLLYSGFLMLVIGAFILFFASGIEALYVGAVFLGLGFGPGFPVVLGYVGDLFSSMTGTAFGIVMTIALVGNTTINGLVGFMSDNYGMGILPIIMIFCTLMMILLLSVVLKNRNYKLQFKN